MNESSAYGSNSKISSAKKQATGFVDSLKTQTSAGNASTAMGVVTFSDTASSKIDLTNDFDNVTSTINGLSTISRTNIYAGLQEGIDQLEGSSGQKIMVFLSDGKDTLGNSDSSILDLARGAKSKGIKIYTIGFGATGAFNEDLLKQMASITGGGYAHEDPSSLTGATVGIFATMTKAQLSTSFEIVNEKTGTVAQGKIDDAGSFKVASHGDAQLILYWPGSTLELKLVDPDGVEVDENYPGYTVQSDGIPTQIYIEGAKQGDWGMSVYGADVSMAEEPYYAVAAFKQTTAPQATPTVQQTTPTAPAVGTAQDNSGALIFVLIIAAILVIGGVAAYTVVNRKKEESDKDKENISKL
jgi:hypothetical protein